MHMKRFEEEDRVRIDIPDETDPNFDRFHGQRGSIVEIIHDDAGLATGDERDPYLYRVELDSGVVEDFRWRALRPA